MKIVITNIDGTMIRRDPSLGENVIDVAHVSEILEYNPTDANIIGWYEVKTPNGDGYIQKDDAEIINGVFSSTKEERKYLAHLLEREEKYLMHLSVDFLKKSTEETFEFIKFIRNLKYKILEVELYELRKE